MAFSLYDASVANYLQTLGAVSGVLERGLVHFRENNVDSESMVEARLAPDMLPLRFQIISVAQHSRGAIEAAQSGEFRPPSFKTPCDLDLDHCCMWRTYKSMPVRGRIGSFNRSYY